MRHHLDVVARLERDWSAGRAPDMARTAHSLKSVAAALGMHALSDAAAALEAALQKQPHPEEVMGCIRTLSQAMSWVEAHARQILARHEAPAGEAGPSHSAQEVQAAWQALRDALARNDMQAYVLWRQWGAQFRATLSPEACSQLQRDVETFDFPSAHALLSKLTPGSA